MAELLPSDTRAKCLNCGYALRGLQEPRCPECGREFDPTDPNTFCYGGFGERLKRHLSEPIGWAIHLLAITGAVLLMIGAVVPEEPKGLFRCNVAGALAWLFVGVIWIPRLLLWLILTGSRPGARHGWWHWLVAPAAFIGMVVVCECNLPVRVGIMISRQPLEALAQEASGSPGVPILRCTAGVYEFVYVEGFDRGVRFCTHVYGRYPGPTKARYGFAYLPGPVPSEDRVNYYEHLQGSWYLWRRIG